MVTKTDADARFMTDAWYWCYHMAWSKQGLQTILPCSQTSITTF